MLRALHIRDFVIVDRLELEFEAGFTALTGETGAGKSLLIDALSLVLGERSDTSWVREGCDKAEITAEFDVSAHADVRAVLREQELDRDDQLILRRVLERGGRSRAYVNGSPGTLQQLKDIGERLVDIHGQHEHQSLLRVQAQRSLLDGYAGATKMVEDVQNAYRTWQALLKARQDFEENAAKLQREREEVADKVSELKQLKLNPSEWDELEVEHRRLANAASLIQTVDESLSVLSEGEAPVLGAINATIGKLGSAADLDPALTASSELVDAGRIQIQEAVRALRRYRDHMDIDPRRLAEVESRIQALHTAARKFRVRPPELADTLKELQDHLARLNLAGDANALAEREAQALESYQAMANQLSEKRKAGAAKLSERVTQHMQRLAMAGSSFVASLQPLEVASAHGMERPEFLVSTHGGGTPKSLAKVASGGELSRISLAIQTLTSEVADVPTLIFDEVDAGIGGGVAEIVGRMMRDLGAKRQVMCVTHLPQVASAASAQWRVMKQDVGGRPNSVVQTLKKAERIEEIARMLGGVKITDTTRKHAAEMLGLMAKVSI